MRENRRPIRRARGAASGSPLTLPRQPPVYLIFVLGFAIQPERCGGAMGAFSSPGTTGEFKVQPELVCTGGTSEEILFVAGLVFLVLAPIAVAIHLGRRLSAARG